MNKTLIVLLLFIFLILNLIIFDKFIYYFAYLIDYLINKDSYTFSEESQYNNNNQIYSENFLTNYMKSYRNETLKIMNKIDSIKIPEININELSKEKIILISKNFTQPFVIRGLIKDFDCVKKWDLNYFQKEYGDIEIPTFIVDKNISYSKNTSTKIKKCNNTNFCSIKEICKNIKLGEPLYINNISKLFTVSKQASDELNLDKIADIMNNSFLNQKTDSKSFMSQLFLGGKNTGTSLHCASNVNFFFNIRGTKHWGFIDPKYTHLIKCQSSRNGLFAVSDDDFFSESEDNIFLKIPRYETILNSGDFLFNPAWYWHAVKNKSDYTIAVANRYVTSCISGEIQIINNNLFFSFLQIFSFSYYYNFFFLDKTKSYQQNYGTIVDKEIIDSLSKNTII